MNRFDLDPTSLAREEPVRFPGPVGELEGLWRPAPPGGPARGVAVVAHPLPTHGGTMLNKVVFHTARVLNHDLRLATLRFNFRGVGASAGEFDDGIGERDDLAAAWTEARRRAPDGPLVAAGFSFGAAMTLALAAVREEPASLALVGLPFRMFEPPTPFPRPLPLAAVHGENDQFTPPDRVAAYLETWPGPSAWHVVAGADHFLYDDLPEAIGFLAGNVGTWLGLPGSD